MGLAGQKNRTKLSQDPNNTSWAKSTDNFGHKILTAQGWKPGQYLGAENANHSEHYTAANASHIRVMLREDNLGIGAQKGKTNAETFGLSTLSGIFGRLNGKSEVEVEKQQNAQRDVELRTYQSRKHGTMNFVSGGLLIGDKMEIPEALEVKVKVVDVDVSEAPKKKKRKAVDDAEGDVEEKANKKSKKRKSESKKDVVPGSATEKAQKKSRKNDEGDDSSEESLGSDTAQPSKELKRRSKRDKTTEGSVDTVDKSQLKAEKRARKEERRRRKEEKRQKKDGSDVPTTTTVTLDISSTNAPQALPAMFAGSRHAVRQRYIQQKRMASMDPQALREILMMKAGA